jgi:hypothetical protein
MALQVNSRNTYASHHKTYLQFCFEVNHDPLIAITEHLLCAAIVFYVRTHKITTLPQYVSAVANWHHEHELGELPRDRLYYRVQKGLGNVFGLSETVEPKTAITLEDLSTLYTHMDINSFIGARDWLCYIMAFFGLLRIHEYIGTSLKFSHVKLHSWGIGVTIPFSKTNLQPVCVRIIKREAADIFDPVTAYLRYIAFIPVKLRHGNMPFILHQCDRSVPLPDHVYMQTFKLRVKNYLHKSPENYAGHSFRRGGTTALFLAGVPETVIAAHGRWKSLAYRKYFDATINSLLPTSLLYDHSKAGRAQ